MNYYVKILVLIFVLINLVIHSGAQNLRDQRLIITNPKAYCQKVNGVYQKGFSVTVNMPNVAGLTYTISGGGLTSNVVLSASSGTFNPPGTHSFIVSSLADGVTYSVIATGIGIGSASLTFTTNFNGCGPIAPHDSLDVPIVIINDCPIPVNLVKNGSFFYGNDGSFESDLPLGCNSCSASRYCVGNQFSVKCNSWPPNTWDQTLGTPAGNYMLVDGNPFSPSTVWRDTVYVCFGELYTFSFWVKSIYQEGFDLGMMINNNTTPAYTTIPQISGASLWRKYSYTWTSNVAGYIQIGIRQLTGGHRRDFGLDDISFEYCCRCSK